jgi:hypothetical protein
MCKFRLAVEVPAMNEAIEEELYQRVPEALCVLAIDSKGDITLLRTSQAEAQVLDEDHGSIPIKSINSSPATISIISTTENPHECVWMTLQGTPIRVCPRHR